jgi:hypothetical protein
MKNLVIGNTSQLAKYFPNEYEKISSRNIQFTNEKYDRVYLCFSERRENLDKDLYYSINIDYTLKIIDHYSKNCNNIIIYGTTEFWNAYNGAININLPFKYNTNDYIDSKRLLIEISKKLYKNIIVLYPFEFNSININNNHLFYNIFDSIINKNKINIDINTYYYKELLHPKFVVEQSIKADNDSIIGSGRLLFYNDFIRSLYLYFSMEYDDYVTEHICQNSKNIYYFDSKKILYNNIYNDTIREIEIKLNLINE